MALTTGLFLVSFAYHRATGDRGSINDSIIIVAFMTCLQLMCILLLILSAARYFDLLDAPELPPGFPLVTAVSVIVVYFWLRKRLTARVSIAESLEMTRREAISIVAAYNLFTFVLVGASFFLYAAG